MWQGRDTEADQRLLAWLRNTPLESLSHYASEAYLYSRGHGLTQRWLTLFDELPAIAPGSIDLATQVRIGQAEDGTEEQRATLESAARTFMPWRKGPWSFFGIEIDTEWRSDMKWNRLLPHIQPLAGRRVLDVGCGNGYHCYRMFGANAELVLGVDPHPAYFFQYRLMQHYLRQLAVFVLPITLDQFPAKSGLFDTVFSMGVLYHRRSPIDHLLQLQSCLREGGELVLESLVVDGPDGYALMPEDRYCQMKNVWFLPSVATTESWLRRCGYRDVRTVDVNATDSREQRSTAWMPFQSLRDGLDPHNPALSIEGLPAPKRAITLATAPPKRN